jgi:hypothetical protein
VIRKREEREREREREFKRESESGGVDQRSDSKRELYKEFKEFSICAMITS